MFEILLWAVPVLCVAAALHAYSVSRDSLHPLVLICPMFAALYWWVPWQQWRSGDIYLFLDEGELEYVQSLNLLGVVAFCGGCLGAGVRRYRLSAVPPLDSRTVHRMRQAAYGLGALGLLAWLYCLHYVGGFWEAYGRFYGGGFAASGYVRDAQLVVFPAMLLLFPSLLVRRRLHGERLLVMAMLALPWLIQGLLGARRGPTFLVVVTISIGWCLVRGWRPPLAVATLALAILGYLVLFLVVNRNEIYLGSNMKFQYDVTSVASAGSGNEYVYGAGAILHADQIGSFYWGKRYLAQFVVRPVPRQLWPNKYADFGLPELETNFGTGGREFLSTLGWAGAIGSAPGIVADLWLEFRWLAFPALATLGWLYGLCWRCAVTKGGVWSFQYAIVAALSLYMVMQTMEAVIFRFLIMSAPLWVISWDLKRKRYRPAPLNRRSPHEHGLAGTIG